MTRRGCGACEEDDGCEDFTVECEFSAPAGDYQERESGGPRLARVA
jgi:hypothetical protein